MAPASQQNGSERRKWFADEDLDDSMEISMLKEQIARIKIPGGKKNPDLESLMDSILTTDRDQQETNLKMLNTYLEKWKNEQDEKERKREEAENKKEEGRGPLSKTIHKVVKSLIPPMMKTFEFILYVLDKTIFIASELTFQTHYEVALKGILLLQTAYNSAGSLTEDMISTFEDIVGYMGEMKFMVDELKARPVYKAVNKLFLAIVAFVAGAASYLSHGVIPKMVFYLGGMNNKFYGLIKSVADAYDEMTRVRDVAHLAIALATLDKAESLQGDTLKIINGLKTLGQQVSKLVERPDAFNELAGKRLRALYNHTNFQADLHVQMLRSELFERPYEPSQELAFNDYERIFLSPRDRWHRHFHGFESWSVPGKAISSDQAGSSAAIEINKRRSRALIWISGNTGRQNVSWVSSLSVDLLAHLREFSNIDTAYVFCKRGHGVRYTPAMIIKGLAAQLLEQYPEVAIQNVRILSKKRFQEVGDYQKPGAARLAWRLLQDVVRLMEDAARTRNCKVLILIDRLDLCVSNEDFSVLKDLIPRLQQLSHQSSLVRVMITAAKVPALKVPTLRTAPEWLLSYGKCFHTPDRKGESDEQG